MNSPERRTNQEVSLADAQKEKESNPIFVVRFGFGPHSIRYSDWHVHLGQDLDSFFEPSDSPQRNIFYMEDATGSQSFVNKAKEAYRVYGSWLRAYFWADLGSVWRELDLSGEERFPSEDKLDRLIDVKLSSLSGVSADNYYFCKATLVSIDEMIQRKNIKIELETETRKNAQERSSVQNTTRLLEENMNPTSSDEMRDWIMRMWNLRKTRDSKISDDILDLYKRTYKQKVPTKIYVSLGEGHLGAQELLGRKLGKRPSYNISLSQGSILPELTDISSMAVRFDLATSKAFAILDSGTHVSSEEWQGLYEEVMNPHTSAK